MCFWTVPLVHEGLITSPFWAVGQSDMIPLPQLVTQPIALGHAYFENQMTSQLQSGSLHVCFSHGLSFLFSGGKPKPKSTLTFPRTCYGSLFACQALLILQLVQHVDLYLMFVSVNLSGSFPYTHLVSPPPPPDFQSIKL